MKKTRLLSLVLVICALLICALVVTSCGGNTNTQTGGTNTNTGTGGTNTETDDGGEEENELYTYTVYFENQNGQPIEGVNAQLCLPGGFCLPPKTSDAEGVCRFQFTELTNLEIQINSVPDGYIMIEGYIPFPEGKTSRVVTIEQNVTYTVTASDLYGQKLENILVELYKEEGDELVESKISGSNGRVEFTVSPDKYYAVVKHAYDNGAFKLIGDTNVVSFEKTKNMQVQFTILDAKIDYSILLKNPDGTPKAGANVKLYNSKFALVEEATTGDDGVASFKVQNGTYYATTSLATQWAKTVIFEKNGQVSAEVTIENVVPGADKQHPIMILGNTIEVDFEAGAQVWYSVPFAKGKTVEINSTDIEILYGGKTNKPQDGKITLQLKEEGEAAFRIKSTADVTTSLTGEIYKLGSLETPNKITVDSQYTFTGVTVEENGRVYYTFVADKDGTIRIATETDYAVVTINGNPFKKSVKAGDTVVICFYTQKEVGDTLSAPAATIDAELEFAQTKADYDVSVKVDNTPGASLTVELYEKVGDNYVLVTSGVANEEGKIVFAEIDEKATYYVKAIFGEEYEAVNEYEPFADETSITVYVTHKRDGSQMYPFLVDSENGTNTTEVVFEANGEVWYTLFYITGSTITIDNANATVELYTQTGDGSPEAVTTLTGTVLSYTLDGSFGTTTRLLIKISLNEAGTVNLTYTAPQIEEE